MKIFEPDEIPIVSWVPAKEAASRINDLEAENQRLRDALVSIAGGDIYPRSIANQALEKET